VQVVAGSVLLGLTASAVESLLNRLGVGLALVRDANIQSDLHACQPSVAARPLGCPSRPSSPIPATRAALIVSHSCTPSRQAMRRRQRPA
jgi:hypothetical protein